MESDSYSCLECAKAWLAHASDVDIANATMSNGEEGIVCDGCGKPLPESRKRALKTEIVFLKAQLAAAARQVEKSSVEALRDRQRAHDAQGYKHLIELVREVVAANIVPPTGLKYDNAGTVPPTGLKYDNAGQNLPAGTAGR